MYRKGILFLLCLVTGTFCQGKVQIVAHRGASGYAPENTLEAFKLAWEMNADAIEGDFQMTKDKRIVCIHDSNTRNVALDSYNIAETDFATLRNLDVSRRFKKGYENVRMPSLEEVLAIVPKNKKIYGIIYFAHQKILD